NQTLAELHVEQHPDKTSLGRISRGFDLLGSALTPAGRDAAPPTIERYAQRVSQLDEQGVELLHIRAYVRRWLRWARGGLRALGAGLSERAWELVVRSLVRLGWLGGGPPPPDSPVDDHPDGPHPRHQHGRRLRDRGERERPEGGIDGILVR